MGSKRENKRVVSAKLLLLSSGASIWLMHRLVIVIDLCAFAVNSGICNTDLEETLKHRRE